MKKTKKRVFLPQDFTIDWESLEPIYNELISRELSSLEGLEQWLKDRSELEAALEEDFAWRYIKMTCDTCNEDLVQSFQYFASEIEPKISPLNNELNKKFISSKLSNDLSDDNYFIYIRGIKKALALFREENIPIQTQLQIEQQKYQSITGSMSVKLNGQDYTLEQASNYLKDIDREVRETTWKTITKRRLQDANSLNDLFNHLISLRHQMAVNAGFDNYRDYMFEALGRFDYTVEDCYNFHDAIRDVVVPVLEKQSIERKNALHLTQLKPWDTEVDTSGKVALKPFENGAELIDKTIDCFGKIGESFGEKLQYMKDHQLFDVESRMGKAPGGYNYPLAESGAPFIFMNAAQSFRDLTTMVHEGGHAIHTFLTADLDLNDFKHCPSEVAELASMSMELISMDHWDVFFKNEEDLKRAKKYQLRDVLKTLPWVAVIDKFQHWIYTHPTHTTAERTEAWQDIFTSYGAGFTSWDEHQNALENLWQKQLHLFEVPFYYIEYGIAQLGAIAVWKNYKQNPQFGLQQYTDALKLGYTKTLKEIYQTAGISFDFSANYIKELIDFVQDELAKLGE